MELVLYVQFGLSDVRVQKFLYVGVEKNEKVSVYLI